jgi:polysaccharide export outer membrane protein
MFHRTALAFPLLAALAACAPSLPEAPLLVEVDDQAPDGYQIGPGDMLKIFVWQSADLSTQVKVRPDGRISVPLIEDLDVAGSSPTAIARRIETRLADYMVDPKVTVIVQDFIGQAERQVRVVGAAMKPAAIPYHRGMTVLDVVIASGGLTTFADGNRAVLVRRDQNRDGAVQLRVRLADLVKDGDMSANARVAPGDVLMIPLRWF